MDPLILGAAALALLALGRRPSGAAGGPSDPDAEITFGPVTAPRDPPKTFWCSPTEPWGGFSDEKKIALAEDVYVSRWGFDPPREFGPYIAKLDPCKPDHVPKSLTDQFPPFPNQKLKASELARLAKEQAVARAARRKQEADAAASCKQAAEIVGTIVGVGAGAAAVVLTGGAAAPAAGAAGVAGRGLGALVGSFC